jgi:hypothetical protein
MKIQYLLALVIIYSSVYQELFPQGVAISSDDSNPDPSAILDVKSTNSGILFPRMTGIQRDAIQNPADGLHIFNTTSGSLEYYDALFKVWISYCKKCGFYSDTIVSTETNPVINYQLPLEAAEYPKVILVIQTDSYIVGTSPPAIDLSSLAPGTSIIIENYGYIIGKRGRGGDGGSTTESENCPILDGRPGYDGGNAIASKPGTRLTIYNYGVIGGGGGGGGGGGAGYYFGDCGGGGGSGAGCYESYFDAGQKGLPRVFYDGACVFGAYTLAQDGQDGTFLLPGNGGEGGQSGGPLFAGYAGGNGGGLGQPGQNGIDSFYSYGGPGGQPGKAISGNAGNNTVTNLGSGIIYGLVD